QAVNDIPWRFPPAPRIVAVGDLHGDLDAARRALRLAGAIDERDRWIGGTLVLVQTGDQIDRGDDDQAVLDLFSRLADEAAPAGGAVHALLGNHELMNAALDFRYPSPAGFADFEDAAAVDQTDTLLVSLEPGHRARAAAFRPGGPYAKILARRNTAIVIGSNVFVHGGVLPDHLDHGLGCVNGEVREWLDGTGPFPKWMLEKSSPVWARTFSLDVDSSDCETLRAVLERLGAKRMIVGHTDSLEGIRSYCDGTAWCIDAGMSRHYGGRPQVLEIRGDSIYIIREP
ncbi:MAG: metallophosphoesterase, partial [Chitinivibrionia bacterium]|nr:metallophosphoesterase [Chitinivibrionia bacterium]